MPPGGVGARFAAMPFPAEAAPPGLAPTLAAKGPVADTLTLAAGDGARGRAAGGMDAGRRAVEGSTGRAGGGVRPRCMPLAAFTARTSSARQHLLFTAAQPTALEVAPSAGSTSPLCAPGRLYCAHAGSTGRCIQSGPGTKLNTQILVSVCLTAGSPQQQPVRRGESKPQTPLRRTYLHFLYVLECPGAPVRHTAGSCLL